MFNYSNSIEKQIKMNPDLFVNSFKMNVMDQLKAIDCRAEIKGNVIHFRRIVRILPRTEPGKTDVFKLLKEGNIEINEVNKHKIFISWSIKLDTLLFFSIVVGLIIGLFIGFANSSFLIFAIIGIFSPSIPFCIGYFLITNQIDEIILNSLLIK